MNFIAPPILFFALMCVVSLLQAQSGLLPIKRDDFNQIHSWWNYHKEGNPASDSLAILNGRGYLRIRLKNPTERKECNVGISDFQNIYGKHIKYLSVEARIKLLTPMHAGSRGWGFWKSRKNAKSHTLAWFMQQMDDLHPQLSWSKAGTIVGKKRNTKIWPVDNRWHVYRIERDLRLKRTRFWIDGKLFLETPNLAPKDRLSFHLWIDNQVYSRKNGIKRKGWQGTSALVVDYVQIETSPRPSLPHAISEPPFLFYARYNSFHHQKEEYFPEHNSFRTTGGDIWILMTARAEDLSPYDEPDQAQLFLGDAAQPALTFDGQVMKGKDETLVVRKNLPDGEYAIRLKERATPLIYDLAVVDGSAGKVVLNMKGAEFFKQGPLRLIKISKRSTAALYVAVSAREAGAKRNKQEDRLRLLLSGSALSEPITFNFNGNEQFGDCKTVVQSIPLKAGELKLRVQTKGKPQFHRIFLLLKDSEKQ